MNKILNHLNQENLPPRISSNISHPSKESQPKQIKPSIKVGYKLIESSQRQLRPYRKPIVVVKPQQRQKLGVKKVVAAVSQAQSGKFIQSEYVPTHPEKQQVRFHRRAVEEVQSKYHSGRQFSQQLRNQFLSKNRSSRSITERSSIPTERSKLSGYKNQGIKDIIEYRHAGTYRESKIANKCNNQKVKERNYGFSDIHDLDFRRLKAQI